MRACLLRCCVIGLSLLVALFLSLSPRLTFSQSNNDGNLGASNDGNPGNLFNTGFNDGQNAALQNARGPAQAQAATTIPPPSSGSSGGSSC